MAEGPQGNHDREIAEKGSKSTDIDTSRGVKVHRDGGKEGIDGLNTGEDLGRAISNLPGDRLTFFQKLRKADFHSLSKGFKALAERDDGFSVAFFTDAVDAYQENNGMAHGDELKSELADEYDWQDIESEFEDYRNSGLLTDSEMPSFTGEAVETYNLVEDLIGGYDERTVLNETVSGRLDPKEVSQNRNGDIRSAAVASDLDSLAYQKGDGMRALMYIAESPGSATNDYTDDAECSKIVDELIDSGLVEKETDLQLTAKGETAHKHIDRAYDIIK